MIEARGDGVACGSSSGSSSAHHRAPRGSSDLPEPLDLQAELHEFIRELNAVPTNNKDLKPLASLLWRYWFSCQAIRVYKRESIDPLLTGS